MSRISRITLWAHRLQLAVPYVYGGGQLDAATTLIVRSTTEDGLEGWGESCPLGPTYQPAHALGGTAAVQEFAPKLLGQRALPRVLSAVMDGALDGHNYAKALIDIAAWDILGKRAGLPLHTVLGGALVDPVPSYFAVRPLPPKEMAEEVQARVAEGYRTIQIKIGSGDLQADADSVRAAWKAAPSDIAFAADANRTLLVEDVVHLSRMLRDVPVALEQPCRTPEEMRQLKGRVHHPIYWDESMTSPGVVLEAVGQGHCDGLGMKVTRVGGISGMIAVRDMSVARNMKLSVDDSWGGDIIAAACVHLGATVPPRLFRGTWLAQPFIGSHYDRNGGVHIEGGHIALPKGPGLGVMPEAEMFGPPVAEFEAKI